MFVEYYFLSALRMSKRVKLNLKAQVATVDDYGRFRFLLLNELNSGRKDFSAQTLARSIPRGMSTPYKLWEARDGVVGEFWTAVPKTRTSFWKELYTSLRGQEVSVTVCLRKYSFAPAGSDKRITGVSLDVIDLEKLNEKAEKKE